jgi:hypothetical protein
VKGFRNFTEIRQILVVKPQDLDKSANSYSGAVIVAGQEERFVRWSIWL